MHALCHHDQIRLAWQTRSCARASHVACCRVHAKTRGSWGDMRDYMTECTIEHASALQQHYLMPDMLDVLQADLHIHSYRCASPVCNANDMLAKHTIAVSTSAIQYAATACCDTDFG